MTIGIVASALLFFPAAPFFLFMHGKDITFPKGTEVPTFVDGNFTLDLSKFQPTAAPAETATSTTEPAKSSPNVNAEINITSTPLGAEVQIDGVFVGSTP